LSSDKLKHCNDQNFMQNFSRVQAQECCQSSLAFLQQYRTRAAPSLYIGLWLWLHTHNAPPWILVFVKLHRAVHQCEQGVIPSLQLHKHALTVHIKLLSRSNVESYKIERNAQNMHQRTMPTFCPGWYSVPLCRMMMLPARQLWPPYNFTPNILGKEPPRFCVEPPCFLEALHQGKIGLLCRYGTFFQSTLITENLG